MQTAVERYLTAKEAARGKHRLSIEACELDEAWLAIVRAVGIERAGELCRAGKATRENGK